MAKQRFKTRIDTPILVPQGMVSRKKDRSRRLQSVTGDQSLGAHLPAELSDVHVGSDHLGEPVPLDGKRKGNGVSMLAAKASIEAVGAHSMARCAQEAWRKTSCCSKIQLTFLRSKL